MVYGTKPALACLAVALLALPWAVPAQTSLGKTATYARNQLHQKFLKADKDKDGFLTREEAEAGNLPETAKHFDKIDATGRGKVSEKEIQTWWLEQAGKRAAKPPAGGT
ncbi:EF-hand domain-containing protein [Luteibacter aegosomaticola]|uniref:EF-hand domain-containing protein n=1 Tax=Luteibacter aegosomaticola TaxID=2911538 RepID=UPI001FFB2194|nr:EF-hand domain-containing protein [Luteibacter aegosomaticola]UPG91506.1 EF-hand domain-containing protein [Luteibacter aegosomaticola]